MASTCCRSGIRAVADIGDEFPKKITAFHAAMMAHGKLGRRPDLTLA